MRASNRSDASCPFRHRALVPSKALLAILLSLTAVLMVLSISGLASADDCSSCHGSSGGYTFKHMTMAFKTTRVVSTDTEFQHIVEVSHPGKYKAKGVTVSVDLSTANGCTMVSAKSQSLGDMSGEPRP